MIYCIEEKRPIKVTGIVKNLGKWPLSIENKKSNENLIGDIWDEYLDDGMDQKVAGYNLY